MSARVQVEFGTQATHAKVMILTADGEPAETFLLPAKDVAENLGRFIHVPGTPEAVATGRGHGLSQIAADPPAQWKIHALPTFGYAYHERGSSRVAIGVWEEAIHPLTFEGSVPVESDEDEDYDEDHTEEVKETYLFKIPACLAIGMWEAERLYVGGFFLCPNGVPNGVGDIDHLIHPWHLGNVWTDGAICFGSASRPEFGLDGVTAIHDTFFRAAFNNDIPGGCREFGGRSLDLWRTVQRLQREETRTEPYTCTTASTALTLQQALISLASNPR
jgi:hypothetical protein